MEKQVKKKKRRKLNKRTIVKLISIVLLVASITMLFGVGKEVISVINLKNEEAQVQEQLAILEQENADLMQTKAKLEDPNYVTTYARGEYMFSKGDEKLFRLPSKGE